MWTLSQDITGLLLAVRMKYAFTNLLIYLLTYEYRETFRRGLTADSRLLIAMVCERGSLIKLRGLMRIEVLQSAHFCWPDNTGMGTALPATHEALPCSRATAAAVDSFNMEDVEWPKYKNEQGSIWCDHWSSCCNLICMCWMARCRTVAYWPSIRDLSDGINQMTVFEIIIAVLHCLSDCMLAYYARSCECCCELDLCLVSSAHDMCRISYDLLALR